jgi:hypothetical protein
MSSKEPTYTLYYFPVTGNGEVPRLIFEVASVPYKNRFPQNWPTEKDSTPFGKLPVLYEELPGGNVAKIY